MKKDIIRVYECEKCKLPISTTNNELTNLTCKNCGGTLKFNYSYQHNPNNGLKAIKKYGSIINTNQKKIEVHCPYCNSTNCKKISGISKATSVAMFGIFSQKVKKQWHCSNCNSNF